jgi:DNA repair exonuclease SbcCD nuclease subunit
VKRLPTADYDYVALGDWHGTSEITPKAWYSGTPETDRFPKGADNDPGNILEVVASRGLPPQVTKTRTSHLNWVSLDHRFTADEQVAEIEAKLLNEILAKADTTLIKLHFTGSLGIQASGALQKLYAVSRARSIRLKLKDEVGIAPTQEEIDKLCSDKQNQLIALVASKLVELTKTNPAEAAKASLALRELFSAV